MTGAVTTPTVVRNNNPFLQTPKFTKDLFLEAANGLETFGLGRLVDVVYPGKGNHKTKAFIKNPPGEVMAILNLNPDLCSPQYYEERYKQPLAKSLSLALRHQLAVSKLVPKQLLL